MRFNPLGFNRSLTYPVVWLAVGVFLGGVLIPGQAGAADLAVVVNSDVEIDELKFNELRKIMLGDRQFWKSGQKISIILKAPVADERTFILERVFKMNEDQFRHYWISKVFRAEATSGPRIVLSTGEIVELVEVIAGAISVVHAEDVPSGIKVLKIDGALPGEDGYPLQLNPSS